MGKFRVKVIQHAEWEVEAEDHFAAEEIVLEYPEVIEILRVQRVVTEEVTDGVRAAST